MVETQIGYAVKFPPGGAMAKESFAISSNGFAFFWKRRDAIRFRDELEKHRVRGGKVVKVRMTFEEIPTSAEGK